MLGGGWSSVSVSRMVIGSNGQGHRVWCSVSVLGVVEDRVQNHRVPWGSSVSVSGMVICSNGQGYRVPGGGSSVCVGEVKDRG